MIKLVDIFEKNFGPRFQGVPMLQVGTYEVKNFYIIDNAYYVKVLYLDTVEGMYKTESKNLLGIIFGGLGDLLKEQFKKGETVQIEIISQQPKNGRYGLSFYLGD